MSKIYLNLSKRAMNYIYLSNFMVESDNNNTPSLSYFSLMNFTFECFNNLINSFTLLIENNTLKIDCFNENFTEEQILVKDIIAYPVDSIKNSLTVLLTISSDEGISQSIVQIFQSFINIYGSLGLHDTKNSLIKEFVKITYNSGNY